jgi:hypothetical protein
MKAWRCSSSGDWSKGQIGDGFKTARTTPHEVRSIQYLLAPDRKLKVHNLPRWLRPFA